MLKHVRHYFPPFIIPLIMFVKSKTVNTHYIYLKKKQHEKCTEQTFYFPTS